VFKWMSSTAKVLGGAWAPHARPMPKDSHIATRSIFEDESAASYRARLIQDILEECPDGAQALRLILREINALPDPHEVAHALLHTVRYLVTYAMTPKGPGVLVDIAASSIYTEPLQELKAWTIEPVPALSLDYETGRLPFDDSSVDGVLFCEVLEHFTQDPLHSIIEINRILKPGGFILLTTPNVASWFSIYQALQHKHPSRWPFYSLDDANKRNHIHAREYLVPEVELLLSAGGFDKAVSITRDYGLWPPYRALPGFSDADRGETIFCRAYKAAAPRKRSVLPIYLKDVDFGGA
jgi:SAM-dependent methyltransferase